MYIHVVGISAFLHPARKKFTFSIAWENCECWKWGSFYLIFPFIVFHLIFLSCLFFFFFAIFTSRALGFWVIFGNHILDHMQQSAKARHYFAFSSVIFLCFFFFLFNYQRNAALGFWVVFGNHIFINLLQQPAKHDAIAQNVEQWCFRRVLLIQYLENKKGKLIKKWSKCFHYIIFSFHFLF